MAKAKAESEYVKYALICPSSDGLCSASKGQLMKQIIIDVKGPCSLLFQRSGLFYPYNQQHIKKR